MEFGVFVEHDYDCSQVRIRFVEESDEDLIGFYEYVKKECGLQEIFDKHLGTQISLSNIMRLEFDVKEAIAIKANEVGTDENSYLAFVYHMYQMRTIN